MGILPLSRPQTPIGNFVGPFLTSAEITAAGGNIALWKTMFDTYDASQYTRSGTVWSDPYNEVLSGDMGAVYDRAVIRYAFAEGDSANAATLRTRANNIVLGYHRYVDTSPWFTTEPTWQPWSLAAHYLVTASESSLQHLGWFGVFWSYYQGAGELASPTGLFGFNVERLLYHALSTAICCRRCNAAKKTPPGSSFPDYAGTWDDFCTNTLNDILGLQAADGAWRLQGNQYSAIAFQTCVLSEALRVYYNQVNADSRIPAALIKVANLLWCTMLHDGGQTFVYGEKYDTNFVVGTQNWVEDSDDVNGNALSLFGWIYYLTGDTTWRARFDILFNRMVGDGTGDGNTGAFISGTSAYKQLSEFTRWAMTGLYYRQATPLATPVVPVNSVAPALSGSSTLSTTNGSWSNAPSSYAYQWYSHTTTGLITARGTASTQSTAGFASGTVVWCVVTATNASGASVPVRSNNYTVP